MASKQVETTPLLTSCPPLPLSWCFRRPFYECYSTNSSRKCRAQGKWCDLHFIGEKNQKAQKNKKMLGLCKSPEQSGAEGGQVNINLSNCSSSCRIPLKLRSSRKSSWPRCPHWALLSSAVPLLPQGQPDPNVTSSFACRAGRSPNLSVQRRNGAVQAGLCSPHAPPGLGVAAARVGVLQAVTTGGWEGSSLLVRKRGRRMCLNTGQKEKGISEKPSYAQLDFQMTILQ